MSAFLFVLFVWLCLLVFCLLLVGSSFTQCNSCLPTARGSLPLTRAGIFTEQATFSDRRSFVRVAADNIVLGGLGTGEASVALSPFFEVAGCNFGHMRAQKWFRLTDPILAPSLYLGTESGSARLVSL